ncbi:MAG: glutathione synthase [Satyrvirus sp.]|uniref:Glutathione synthase n=1 Tax=Satyrvirus sp. TaxID=2487771 RepID=A0A3G5AD75_9VIRU|nr:MAG: glutathione synthase [Satyrvirus sp.]
MENMVTIYEQKNFPWDKKIHKMFKISPDHYNSLLQTKTKDYLLNEFVKLVTEKKISFPYKRFYITRSNVSKMVEHIKKLKVGWNHESYHIINEGKQKILFPITFSLDTEIKPKYYSYLHTMHDYEKMDVITDYYIEGSRIKAKRSYSKESPYKAWYYDKNYLRSVFDILLKNKMVKKIDAYEMREATYGVKNVQETSHEKPSFLSGLFNFLVPKNATIFDACAGWGDRLISAMINDAKLYLGVDPNSNSNPCFREMVDELGIADHNRYKVVCDGMPDAKLPLFIEFNICFLSPPSYDTEIYSNDPGQSINQYPEMDDWIIKFLYRTIYRTWSLLKNDGYFIIQSRLISIINPYIRYRFPDACYLGAISVRTISKNFKPMWIWKKTQKKSPHHDDVMPSAEDIYKSMNSKIQKALEQKEDIWINKTGILVSNLFYVSKAVRSLPNALQWLEDNDYSRYSKVLIFKTYDYYEHVDDFIRTIKKIGDKLINPLKLVLWNINKIYLLDLYDKGIRNIPITFVSSNLSLSSFNDIDTQYVVIKPTIGSSSYNVIVRKTPHTQKEVDEIKNHMYNELEHPYKPGEKFLIQPYYEGIKQGEISLIYFHDGFHHAINKIIKNDELILTYMNRMVVPYTPDKELLDIAQKMIDTSYEITGEKLYYGRLDFILHHGKYILMEMELIEPNLFFKNDEEQLEVMLEKIYLI